MCANKQHKNPILADAAARVRLPVVAAAEGFPQKEPGAGETTGMLVDFRAKLSLKPKPDKKFLRFVTFEMFSRVPNRKRNADLQTFAAELKVKYMGVEKRWSTT